MKKYHLSILLVLSVFSNPLQAESVSLYNDSNLLHTQNNKAFHDFKDSVSLSLAEPEFVNSYCILTSDSTYTALPKETGIIGPHKNKTTSLLGKIGKVADAASALTGAVGMDIIFSGKNSSLKYKKDNQDIRVLIKAENNEYDPHGLYRLVRFSTTKKERRIQWLQIDAGVIDEDAKKKGYIPFRAEKYGQQSYLLTIPSSEIEKGEYGIIFMGAESTQYIPVATFSVS